MSLDADYKFERINHWLYKRSSPALQNFYLKGGFAKPLKNREECVKSFWHSPVMAHASITKGKWMVPLWSGFYELVPKPYLVRITIPRMGGFHTGICMPSTIYSLFKRCGIAQPSCLARLGGLGIGKQSHMMMSKKLLTFTHSQEVAWISNILTYLNVTKEKQLK